MHGKRTGRAECEKSRHAFRASKRMTKAKYIKKTENKHSHTHTQPLFIFRFIFGNFEFVHGVVFCAVSFIIIIIVQLKTISFSFRLLLCVCVSMQSLLFSFRFYWRVFCVFLVFRFLSSNCCCCCCRLSVCLSSMPSSFWFLFISFRFRCTQEFMFVYSLATFYFRHKYSNALQWTIWNSCAAFCCILSCMIG